MMQKIALLVFAVLFIFSALLLAWGIRFLQNSSHVDATQLINESGGPQLLMDSCARLAKEPLSGDEIYFNSNQLPLAILRLRPQFVALIETDVVNIQLSGGFRHHGLLVLIPPRTNPPYHKWLRTELFPGIYEYREW